MESNSIDQRIVSIESQINACMRGATNIITCPYCGAQNKAENSALCCADFGAVVLVILRKQAQRECLDQAGRIAEAVSRN